jgi:DNA-binding response OmpR family regulator
MCPGRTGLARILVVDDNADVRLALATILEDAGHEIIEAEDGEQVFDLVVSESPELVLLDVMMPRVSGFDALATLKADTRTSQVPVIMVTAKGRPEDMAMARSLGAVEYITKPWADGDVELRVDWALASAQAS